MEPADGEGGGTEAAGEDDDPDGAPADAAQGEAGNVITAERIAALVSALGFDDDHTGHVAKHKGQRNRGLLVRDGKGKAVEFFTGTQLRELSKDPLVAEAFAEKVPVDGK